MFSTERVIPPKIFGINQCGINGRSQYTDPDDRSCYRLTPQEDAAVSTLNPYAKYLDGRKPETILSATAAELASLLAAMGAEKAATAPAPGKWSPAEIVCHLADCEIVFAFRLRQTLAEDGPTIQPFDQDRWAAIYGKVPSQLALAVFRALREWNLQLITTAPPEAAKRTMTHPERGTMTFLAVVETMAGHDLNHLEQLRRIAGV
jgi:hypothetical protein